MDRQFQFKQEADTHPLDFDMETEIALEGLQKQVQMGNMSPSSADQYMRKIFGGFFYTAEEANNGTPKS